MASCFDRPEFLAAPKTPRGSFFVSESMYQSLPNHQISPRVLSIFLVFYMWRPMSRESHENYKNIEEYRVVLFLLYLITFFYYKKV
jgi:hypothetical protein